MATGLQALREQKDAKAIEARNLLENNKAPEDFAKVQASVDALIAECSALDEQIVSWERLVEVEKSNDLSAARNHADRFGGSVDEADFTLRSARRAFVNALRHGVEKLSEEDRALVSAEVQNNKSRLMNIMETPPATGGVLVPTIIMPQLLIKLKMFGGMRDFAQEISTSSGGPISWGTMDDTNSEGEMLAEGVTASDDDLSFGTVSIGASVFSSKTIPISLQILQDSAVNAEAAVLDALAMRIARAQNRKFTTGTGSGEPLGVVNAASLGKQGVAGFTTSVSYDDLVDLEHSVDPAYRARGACKFMFNDATLKALKKMKDNNGRPLWLPGLSSSLANVHEPDRLLSYPYVINQHMATMAASAKSIIFGAGDKYLIRDVMETLILRFTDSAYAKKLQVGFLAFARADGRLIDASNESIRYYQNSAT